MSFWSRWTSPFASTADDCADDPDAGSARRAVAHRPPRIGRSGQLRALPGKERRRGHEQHAEQDRLQHDPVGLIVSDAPGSSHAATAAEPSRPGASDATLNASDPRCRPPKYVSVNDSLCRSEHLTSRTVDFTCGRLAMWHCCRPAAAVLRVRFPRSARGFAEVVVCQRPVMTVRVRQGRWPVREKPTDTATEDDYSAFPALHRARPPRSMTTAQNRCEVGTRKGLRFKRGLASVITLRAVLRSRFDASSRDRSSTAMRTPGEQRGRALLVSFFTRSTSIDQAKSPRGEGVFYDFRDVNSSHHP